MREARWWEGKQLAIDRPFNLSRWFALPAAASIAGVSLIVAMTLSAHFEDRMLARDADVIASFVESMSRVEPAEAAFSGATLPEGKHNEFFEHVAALEEALRINAYDREGVVVWSTDKDIIGRRFDDNDELTEALRGQVVVHGGEATRHPKPEHVRLATPGGRFVENYIPVWSRDRSRVIGVVEVYRVPALLFDAIETGRRLTWAGAALASAVLFFALFAAVRRADRIMRRQREQLLESQTLATVGELSRAVAHSVRNPLAAIRSSAELELHQPESSASARAETMREIVGMVDRIDRLLTDMLTYAGPGSSDPPPSADLQRVVAWSLDAFAPECRRRRVEVHAELPGQLPPVSADERLLSQAFASVMSNAMEAMPDGGRIDVRAEVASDRDSIRVSVTDTGVGMRPEEVERAFDPFYTNKARGLGMGLALVKRIVERSRGEVSLSSRPGRGTSIAFTFRVAHGAQT